VKVSVLERLEAVGAAAWTQLVVGSRMPTPFASYVWNREWVRAFAPASRLEIRKVEDDDGQLVAILPLVESGPGVLHTVGGVDVSDYLDLIARRGREEEAWAALLQARSGSQAVWELHSVPATSPTVQAVPELAETAGITAAVTVEERCPVLTLPRTWEAYLATLSGRHRHELTRKIRRFEREAPEGRVFCASRSAELDARLGDFLDLHRRSRVGKARFMDARMEEFFRRVTGLLAERDAVRMWFLDLPQGPVAGFLCLEWEGVVGLYNSGFHPAYAALAPGLVLLAHVVRDAIARGKRQFDFLRGEERYKYEFGPVPEDVCLVTLRPSAEAPA
jgi:CelD/BcsL family acetyltransferase involved in cellulose biosynthesis